MKAVAFLGGREPTHPIRVLGARLQAGHLEFRYTTHPPLTGTVASAWLLGPGGEVPVQPVAPGVLQAPVPALGGRLVLVVDRLSDPLPPGAPPLPWEVGVFLPEGAVGDWHGADPCGAALTLPGGGAVHAVRVLRCQDRTVIFWQREGAGQDHRGSGLLDGELVAGQARFRPIVPPYDYGNLTRGPLGPGLPVPGQPGGPDLPVEVAVLRFPGVPPGEPLALRVRQVDAHLPGTWRLEFPVPSDRPAALEVNRATSLGPITLRLEEVWLGRGQMLLRFSCQPPVVLHLFETALVQDEGGRTFRATGGSSHRGTCQLEFPPVPPGVRELAVVGEGMRVMLQGPWDLPLAPGFRRAVTFGPGP